MSARESIIPVFVPHFGCPHNCVFCNQHRISGQEKSATAETVRSAIENAEKLGIEGVKQLAFYGGSFTAIPASKQEELLGEAKKYLDRGMINSIRLSTRPDAIDEAVIDRLRRCGVETVELGAQSMCEEVLQLAGRGHTAQDVADASRLIKASGFKLILQMMTGLPGDSLDRTVDTAKKIIALDPDGVRIYPTVVVRDTPMYDDWLSGKYIEHTVEEAVRYCAAIVPMFEKAGIPIIRLGLNPTDELSAGAAAAGAYHPALGELVKSRIMLERAEKLLEGTAPGSDVVIEVHPSRVSQMTGQHRCNLSTLKEKFSLKSIKIISAECDRDEMSLI